MEKYYSNSGLVAIIGDIVDSKKIYEHKRSEYQNILREVLIDINTTYKNEISSNFIITLGDEFQGLLKSSKHLFDILELIQFKMDAVKIRFGVGLGKIYTEIDPTASIGSDGPAYHRARNSLSFLKKNCKKECNVFLESNNLLFDQELNSHLYWVCETFSNWTNLQREIVRIKLSDNDITQQDIADMLKINQSLVSRSIKASKYERYVQSKKTIIKVVEYMRQKI